jgi:hypothetical protein
MSRKLQGSVLMYVVGARLDARDSRFPGGEWSGAAYASWSSSAWWWGEQLEESDDMHGGEVHGEHGVGEGVGGHCCYGYWVRRGEVIVMSRELS